MDCNLPGSSLHGILQARILEWVDISFSRKSSRLRDWTQVFHIAGRHFNLWATREAQSNWGFLSIFLSFFLFLMWTIFNIFIEFVTILLLFYLFVRLLVVDFWPWGMWNLSSSNKDRTLTPSTGTWSLNPWTDRGIPVWGVLIKLNHQGKVPGF